MNNHLSKDQLAMWLIGRCTPEEERHGRECTLCSAEIARFQEPIAMFRRTLQDWSRTKPAPFLAEIPRASRRGFQGAWQWAPVAAAVLILAAVYQIEREPRATTYSRATLETAAPDQWQDDAALMDAIAIHLSRTVPAPMEPIFTLIPATEIIFEDGGPDETP